MRYLVHAHCKQTPANQLAGMLAGRAREVVVYVIGVDDSVALGELLVAGDIDPVKLIGKTRFVETIGTPDGVVNEAQLVKLAEQRIKQLETQHATR